MKEATSSLSTALTDDRRTHRKDSVMATPSTFVNVNQPIGIAATQDGLLYTQYCVAEPGQPAIFKVTDTGASSVFAPTFPSAAGCVEKYLDVNPGRGPWAHKVRHVYVTQGRDVFEITPDGSTVNLFATIPSDVTTHTGITFDRVGTFNNDMILTDVTGNVFRVDSAGAITQIATVNAFIEGPAVVPAELGPHGGEIWVAAETAGTVYSVSASGTVSAIVSDLPGAENVTVIPAAPAELGSSGGAYFAADFPVRIVRYPASDFVGLGGNVLVGQESPGGGVQMISFTGGAYVVSTFQASAYQGTGEGAAFVQTVGGPFVYATKFVCGLFRPEQPQPAEEGPVEPGSYATAINIHNPHSKVVTIVKKAVLLFDGTERDRDVEIPKPPHKARTAELGPDWGMEIDCRDIRDVLLSEQAGTPGPRAPAFIKGWVVIESPDPLDVVAVYTVRTLGEPGGVSIATDRVTATRL
jgi:hypothetical protein